MDFTGSVAFPRALSKTREKKRGLVNQSTLELHYQKENKKKTGREEIERNFPKDLKYYMHQS